MSKILLISSLESCLKVIIPSKRFKSSSFNIFEIAFPWLPLSVFEDFAIYLRDEKKLILDEETIEIVRENFSVSKRYSERELSRLFDSNILKDPADIDDEA